MRPELMSQRLWRMGGVGIIAPLTFPLARADRLARDGVDPAVIPLLGRAPGALFAARYDSTSTLAYSEFGIGIFARPGNGRLGFYCSSLWVDSPESMEAGREIWGLPKDLAQFEWEKQDGSWSVTVNLPEGCLVKLSAQAPGMGLGIPVRMHCFSFQKTGRLVRWPVRSRSAANQTRIAVQIPSSSPLFGLGMGGRYRGMFLDPLHLAIGVPRR